MRPSQRIIAALIVEACLHTVFAQSGGYNITSIAASNASNTKLNGINNVGQIVGVLQDSTGIHGFL